MGLDEGLARGRRRAPDAAPLTVLERQPLERGAAPDSLRNDIVFQRAWLLYSTEQYAEAAPAFMQIYQQDGSAHHEDALFWGAESFFQIGNLDRAQSLFQEYLNTYPDGEHASGARYALGWTQFRQQQYQAAARNFERFLNMRSTSDGEVPYRQDAILRLADSYYAMKQYDAAVRTYRRVEDNAADYALYQTGQALNLDDQPQEAISAFQQLVQGYSDSRWRDEAMYRIGYIHFQEQNYGDAIDAYQRLISAYPESALAARAQYGIGDAHFNAGNLDASVEAYRTVLNEYPNSAFVTDAASGIQYALISLDDPDRAEAIIDSFAAANPNSRIVDELRFRLAEAMYRSGQTDEALAAFRRFVRNSSDADLVPEAYYYLGTIHAERDETDAAEGYLLQLIRKGFRVAVGEQIIAAVKAESPDKDIRYLVISHPHSDHTGGVVPFVREGAALVDDAGVRGRRIDDPESAHTLSVRGSVMMGELRVDEFRARLRTPDIYADRAAHPDHEPD